MDAHLFFLFSIWGKGSQASWTSFYMPMSISLFPQRAKPFETSCTLFYKWSSSQYTVGYLRVKNFVSWFVSCHLYLKPELLHHLCQVIVTECWWEASQESHTILSVAPVTSALRNNRSVGSQFFFIPLFTVPCLYLLSILRFLKDCTENWGCSDMRSCSW